MPPTQTPIPSATYTPVPAQSNGRVTSGLQSLYTFDEGSGSVVRDTAGVGPAEDLTIDAPNRVTWRPGALTVNSAVLIASSGAPTSLIDALRGSNQISLEAWIVPANVTQDGPARILTISGDIYNRDFTLGQGQYGTLPADVYITRLRTTRTDVNGEPSLISPRGTATTALTHLVYVRDAGGTARTYINGQQVSTRSTSGDFSNWTQTFRLALANELSGDRPWLGEFHLVAIYNRALTAAEVQQNFAVGADPANGSSTPQPSNTPLPNGVPTLTATPRPTNTPMPTATATPRPTNTPVPTSTPAPSSLNIQPVSFWENRFLSVWQSEHNAYYNGWATGNDSYWYYFLSYAVDGNTAMYEATGNTQYLDRARYYVDEVIRDARRSSTLSTSQYKDSYMGWISVEDGNKEIVLRKSVMWRFVTRMLRVIHDTPALYNNSSYRAWYDSVLAFTEVNIWDKWYSRGTGNLYRSRTHMAAHWAFIAYDLSLISTRTSKLSQYRTVYQTIDADLRGQIIPNPVDHSAYFWSDIWDSFARPGQDVNHGNHVVAYIVEAYTHGSTFWKAADITGLRNLLMNVIWDGNQADPRFYGYVDGTDPLKGYWQADGWVKLGRFDPAVQRMYEHYAAYKYYLTMFYGNAALNARLLLGG